MRLKMLLVLLLLSNTLYAFDIKPPAPQPGDDELISVTVGEMRQALYYYELTPLMVERIRGLNDNMNLLIREFDRIEAALILSEKKRSEEARRTKFYKNTTLVFALFSVSLGGYIIGGSL